MQKSGKQLDIYNVFATKYFDNLKKKGNNMRADAIIKVS